MNPAICGPGIVWLLAFQKLYTIGWLKSLAIAVVVWIVTSIAGGSCLLSPIRYKKVKHVPVPEEIHD